MHRVRHSTRDRMLSFPGGVVTRPPDVSSGTGSPRQSASQAELPVCVTRVASFSKSQPSIDHAERLELIASRRARSVGKYMSGDELCQRGERNARLGRTAKAALVKALRGAGLARGCPQPPVCRTSLSKTGFSVNPPPALAGIGTYPPLLHYVSNGRFCQESTSRTSALTHPKTGSEGKLLRCGSRAHMGAQPPQYRQLPLFKRRPRQNASHKVGWYVTGNLAGA